MQDFSNAVVMITGATGNLGRTLARYFKKAGASLVLVDRGRDNLSKVFVDLVESKKYYLANCADLTKSEAVQEVVTSTIERFGRIDVLVHTVGGYQAGSPLHQTSLETWDTMINMNARSTFVTCRAVIPQMLKQGSGKIICFAARPGLHGAANASAYAVSKSGVIRLVESMAAELKDKGINANCIIPGTIDTPENREDMPKADHSRWVQPDSLAGVIMFLASETARDIHGATIPVYGLS